MTSTFAALCGIVRRTFDALGDPDDTTLTDAALQVVYKQKLAATKPDVERAIRAVRHAVAKEHVAKVAAIPSAALTIEQAQAMGSDMYLAWVQAHQDDPPPPWYCSHYWDDGGPLCASIRACLALARREVDERMSV